MEPKEKLHSEPLEEVKNSVNETENNVNTEPVTADKSESDIADNEKAEVIIEEQTPEPQQEKMPDDEALLVTTEPEADATTEPEPEPITEAELEIETETELVEETIAATVENEKSEVDLPEVAPVVEETVSEPNLTGEEETVVDVAAATEEASSEIPDEASVQDEIVQAEADTLTDTVKDTDTETAEVKAETKLDKEEKDYSQLSELELINELKELLENKKYVEIQQNVDSIKINFYKKHKANLQEQKKAFVEAGGFEEEFKPESNPYEQELKNYLSDYRQLKFQFNKEIEADKDNNLKIKYEIIEDIKGLVNRKESINKTFQEFRELQQRWRDIGIVPQASMKDLWENYHHHVENFYDYIKINQELRDLDLKKNLEEKIGLCEKAEVLLIEPSILKAFSTLQKLHDAWREIGPVPQDKKEEIWERFKDATTTINKKHQDFFENRKKQQKKNLDAKTALCDKVEEILALELNSHKDWESKSKEIVEIQKYWRTIGFAPKKDNNSIYERFRALCDGFFDKKREFYSHHKEIQTNNLQMKIDLCIQAESLKDSTDWKKATDEYIAIQKKWKEIGPVPRKHSDTVWKRFRAACDFFFNKKSKFFNSMDETQVDNLKLKNDLIEVVENFKLTGNDKDDFEKLRDFQRQWTDIGHVPIAQKNEVQKRFRDVINQQFDKLRVDDRDRNLMKYKSKVSDLRSSSRGQNKVYAERDKFAVRLKQLESDLITLTNNIGFFSNSKNAEALINDVKKKIVANEEQIVYLKEKIRIIDETENYDE